jgi:hypothetical protein
VAYSDIILVCGLARVCHSPSRRPPQQRRRIERDSLDAVQVSSLPYSHAGFPGPLECLSVLSQAQVRSRTQPGLTALCWFVGLSHSQGLRCVVGQAHDQCREQTSSAGASLGAVTGYSLLRLITRAFNALLEQQRSSIW